MSVFHMTPDQVRDSLKELPSSHSKEEITGLITALQTDMENDPGGLTFTQTVHRHANTHKELFFSYPMLFRSVCKRTYRQVVLDVLLDAKHAMDCGEKTKKEALEEVIKKSVDDVTAFRAKEKKD